MPPPILITRPAGAAESFAAALRARLGSDCQIVISPLLEIEMLDSDLSSVSAGTLIFTSAHAVRAFIRLNDRRDLRCYAVGSATARVATAAGFRPTVGEGTGAALAEQLIAENPPRPCLYLRGEHVAFDMAERLNAAGIETHSKILYRQHARRLSAYAQEILAQSGDVIMPLFSPRSALEAFRTGGFSASIHVVAMSENVAKSVPQNQVKTLRIADNPDVSAMVNAVIDLCSAANRLEGRDPAQ